jgi:hypothetical protein
VTFQAGWSRIKNVTDVENERILSSDTIRGSARFEVLPNRLTLDGGADYNLLEKNLVSTRARLRFGVQCCGFTVETIRYDFNTRQEHQFRFSIELANIGSFGSFLGGGTP